MNRAGIERICLCIFMVTLLYTTTAIDSTTLPSTSSHGLLPDSQMHVEHLDILKNKKIKASGRIYRGIFLASLAILLIFICIAWIITHRASQLYSTEEIKKSTTLDSCSKFYRKNNMFCYTNDTSIIIPTSTSNKIYPFCSQYVGKFIQTPLAKIANATNGIDLLTEEQKNVILDLYSQPNHPSIDKLMARSMLQWVRSNRRKHPEIIEFIKKEWQYYNLTKPEQ